MPIGNEFYLNGLIGPNGPTHEDTERLLFITFGPEAQVELPYGGVDRNFWKCDATACEKFEILCKFFKLPYSIYIRDRLGSVKLRHSTDLNAFEAQSAAYTKFTS